MENQRKMINDCPLNGQCLRDNIVYQAEVSTNQTPKEKKIYIGSTKRPFKRRYKEHLSSFEGKRAGTKLTNHIQELKEKGRKYNIKWKVINYSRQSLPSIKYCTLCNLERLEIARAEKRCLLNSRNELVAQCVHNPNLYFRCINLPSAISADEKT